MVRPRLCAAVAGLTIVGACHAGPPAAASQSRAWPTMGTMLTGTVWGRDTVALDRALDAAFDSVRLVDSLLSTYRPESEISRINRGAGSRGQAVSPTFAAVAREALAVAAASHGAFDPTLQDWRGVQFATVAWTVRLDRGLRLDFGGIAKGYALDRAVLAFTGVADSGVLDLGGQVLFLGKREPGNGKRHQVGIVDPVDSRRLLALIEVDSGSVSTSSQAERPGHIVDPRTGRPAVLARSVTVVAPSGTLADAWSTAFFVLGCDSALALAGRLGLDVLCADRAVRWSAGLDGRVALPTDSAAGSRGPAPAPTRAAASGARRSMRRSRAPGS